MGPGGPGDLGRLRENDPEMFELHSAEMNLERETMRIVEAYRTARQTGEKEKIKDALAKVVREHFKVRQQRRELEVKRLEQQLDRLRDSIRQRTENAETIINQRIGQLLGEGDLQF